MKPGLDSIAPAPVGVADDDALAVAGGITPAGAGATDEVSVGGKVRRLRGGGGGKPSISHAFLNLPSFFGAT